jgi:hypothetical protein
VGCAIDLLMACVPLSF